jgi:hypothetical protein
MLLTLIINNGVLAQEDAGSNHMNACVTAVKDSLHHRPQAT